MANEDRVMVNPAIRAPRAEKGSEPDPCTNPATGTT